MILPDSEIKKRLRSDIIIEPFTEKRLNPNSYNLTLYDILKTYKYYSLDMKDEHEYDINLIPWEGMILKPGRIYLAKTIEYTETHNLVPMINGRSSIGRLGLSVHITAGTGDVGFCGHWTMELSCIQPVRIYAGIEICQICYHTLLGRCENPYNGKYQHAIEAQTSKLFEEF